MKNKRWLLALLTFAMGASFTSGSALAQWHRGPRVGIGINFGFPYYAPYYVPPPYYYPPAPYYYPTPAPLPPAEYIERPEPAPSSPQSSSSQSYWYYCADSKSYYPYVKECPGGWQRVSPTPPPG